MRTGALLSVIVLCFSLAAREAEAGEPARPGGKVAQRRGRQVGKARQEIARAIELEKAALSGASNEPATDLFRAESLRSRARARLRMIDALEEQGLAREPRAYLENARHFEARAREVEGDPGAQALFRQRLADEVGERRYWERMGSYGSRQQRPPKRVSRSKPTLRIRSVDHLTAATAARTGRKNARDRQAVNQAALPSARPNMIRSRPLRFYGQAFGPVFERMVTEMDASQTWIDVGAGRGEALAAYAAWRPDGARVVAVDLVGDARGKAARFPDGRFRVVEGDVTRVRGLGKARLVTDVFAAMSYGDAPDRVIRRYGDLVETGGHAMLFVEEQRNRILARDGRTGEDLVGYLRRVEGFEVEDVRVFEQGTAVLLRRTAGPVKAPRLELLEFQDGGPPRRVFRMPSARTLPGPVESRFAPRPRR